MSKLRQLLRMKVGATLVELTMYIGLFAVVVGAISATGIIIAKDSQNTVFRVQLSNEAGIAFNQVMREMQDAVTFNAGASTIGQNYSVIQFDNLAGETITLDVDQQQLRRKVDAAAAEVMHSSDVLVNKFELTRLNPSNSLPLFSISMEFADNAGNTYELNSAVNFREL